MTFPCLELKFSRIQRTATATSALVRLYRVDDGGVDTFGQQQYVRLLLRERTIVAGPNVTKAQVLTVARQKLAEWAIEEGYTLTADRLVCNL